MGLHLQFIPGPAAYFQGLVLYLSLLKVSFDWGSGLQAESLSKDSLHLRGNLLLVFFGFLHSVDQKFSIFCTFLIFLRVGVLIHWVFVLQNT